MSGRVCCLFKLISNFLLISTNLTEETKAELKWKRARRGLRKLYCREDFPIVNLSLNDIKGMEERIRICIEVDYAEDEPEGG